MTVPALLFSKTLHLRELCGKENLFNEMESSFDDKVKMLLRDEKDGKKIRVNDLSDKEVERYLAILESLVPASNQGVELTNNQLARILNTLAELHFRQNDLFRSYLCFHGMVMALEKNGTKLDLHAFLVEYLFRQGTGEDTFEAPVIQQEESEFKKLIRRVFFPRGKF